MSDPVVFTAQAIQLPVHYLHIFECSVCGALIQYTGDATEKHRKYHEQRDSITIDT